MKVFIPSKGRALSIKTHKLFKDSIVVVHNKREADDYLKCHPELEGRIKISGVKADAYGLTRQREFVCKELVPKGQWFVFCDDNIRRIRAMVNPFYKDENADVDLKNCPLWRTRFNVACSEKRFLNEIVPDIIRHCEQVGAHLAGFSLTDNVLFRAKKYHDCAYVIGKMMVWHNNLEIPFNHEITMEDFYHTGMHLKTYGACVVNNFCQPTAGHYESGGMGKYEERLPYRRKDVKVLMEMFPGLFRVREHEDMEYGTDLALAIHDAKQIKNWQRLQNARFV